MLAKRVFVIVAISFFFFGVVLLFNSLGGITGFAVFEGSDYVKGFYVALWFFVAGAVVLTIANDRDAESKLVNLVRTKTFDRQVRGEENAAEIDKIVKGIVSGRIEGDHLRGDTYVAEMKDGGEITYNKTDDGVTFRGYKPGKERAYAEKD